MCKANLSQVWSCLTAFGVSCISHSDRFSKARMITRNVCEMAACCTIPLIPESAVEAMADQATFKQVCWVLAWVPAQQTHLVAACSAIAWRTFAGICSVKCTVPSTCIYLWNIILPLMIFCWASWAEFLVSPFINTVAEQVSVNYIHPMVWQTIAI